MKYSYKKKKGQTERRCTYSSMIHTCSQLRSTAVAACTYCTRETSITSIRRRQHGRDRPDSKENTAVQRAKNRLTMRGRGCKIHGGGGGREKMCAHEALHSNALVWCGVVWTITILHRRERVKRWTKRSGHIAPNVRR